MTAPIAVAILLLVLAGGYLLMWRGWRRRGAWQRDLPPLPSPLVHGNPTLCAVDALYVGTTQADQWMERIVAHSLGRRSPAVITVSSAGITLDRTPEAELAIPASRLRAVRLDRAGAGRAVRRPEYLVLTWHHGARLLDTVVRPRHAADLDRLYAAATPLVTQGATP